MSHVIVEHCRKETNSMEPNTYNLCHRLIMARAVRRTVYGVRPYDDGTRTATGLP